ncbi:phage tail assembly protein [Moraxella nasibovis]|uniref:phage tail assembly protein n=1 Tax=Moraxella nasibovis TaxID=2904120 RepID=UPI00240FAF53|nr:phage tail assembly protein [Moraxella nasibovis]WFF39594.1 phage tail assembly protein [Moraxella nasibovis]
MTTAHNPTHTIQEQLGSHISIQLDYPITDGHGKQITEITIRRPKVKDLRKVAHESKGREDTPSIEMEISMLSRLTDLLPEDLDALDMADYTKIQEKAQEMMGKPTSQA